ncbi:hypothetical protein CCR96_06990 [Halochromatium roseum]|nr:hypothetical protein [Halochromatium roseum]
MLTQGLEGQVAVLRERLERLMVDVAAFKSTSADATVDSADATAVGADDIADNADTTANAQAVGEHSTAVLPNDDMVVQMHVDAERSAAVDRTSAPPELAVAEPAAPELKVTPEAAAVKLAASDAAASEPAVPAVDGAGTGSPAFDSAIQETDAALAAATPEVADAAGAHEVAAMADPDADADAEAEEAAIDIRSIDEVVDALIDRRSDELDREYQRLARQLSAPAVRPRWPDQNALSETEDEAMTVDAGSADANSQMPAGSSPQRVAVADRPFALQLIGFHSRELLDDFVDRSPLPSRVYMREERFRGRPWFVLIYSLHQDRAAAQRASETLPDVLGRLDLWIRELSAETELDVIETSDGQT